MKHHFLLLCIGLVISTNAPAQVWATATSIHQTNGRVIVFRYIKDFRPGFSKSIQPVRVILAWRYQSDNGMPALVERQRMDAMEDALEPVLEKDIFATLALVSTGENLREWTYYVKSEVEFMTRLNSALSGKPAFPIEVHAAPDPQWTTYETFKTGVKE